MKNSYDPFELDIQVNDLFVAASGTYPITYECTTEPFDCGVDPN